MTGLLSDIPTLAENKKLEELFVFVYFNDLEKVIEFKNQFPGLYARKGNFLIGKNTPFDLTNLTSFNKTIWFDGQWIEDIKPLVEKHRQRTQQMLDFWRAELGQQKPHGQIEYYHYCDYFYCDDPDDYVEVIADPIPYFIEKGFREIDLKLYNRVGCFDFAGAKKLLEQGAKSNVHFYEDDDSSAFSRISNEVGFLATCQVIPEFEVFERNGYNLDFDITKMFSDLLGLAAHQEMRHLLVEYDIEK